MINNIFPPQPKESNMAMLFADAVAKYNSAKSNVQENDTNTLSNKVAEFLTEVVDDNPTYNFTESQSIKSNLPQTVFMASIASEYYSKAQDDIANTKVGNKAVRKKNFKQVMQESFFYGSNRFGNNFIA